MKRRQQQLGNNLTVLFNIVQSTTNNNNNDNLFIRIQRRQQQLVKNLTALFNTDGDPDAISLRITVQRRLTTQYTRPAHAPSRLTPTADVAEAADDAPSQLPRRSQPQSL